jgi:hypothetical protein
MTSSRYRYRRPADLGDLGPGLRAWCGRVTTAAAARLPEAGKRRLPRGVPWRRRSAASSFATNWAGRASRGASRARVRCGVPDNPPNARRRVRSRSRRQPMPGFVSAASGFLPAAARLRARVLPGLSRRFRLQGSAPFPSPVCLFTATRLLIRCHRPPAPGRQAGPAAQAPPKDPALPGPARASQARHRWPAPGGRPRAGAGSARPCHSRSPAPGCRGPVREAPARRAAQRSPWRP